MITMPEIENCYVCSKCGRRISKSEYETDASLCWKCAKELDF